MSIDPDMVRKGGGVLGSVRSSTPALVFLGGYFLTAVLANILYTTPIGRNWPKLSINNFDWSGFSLSGEFWLLLLIPFFLVPPVCWASRTVFQRPASVLAGYVPEFSRAAYAGIAAITYGYVFYSLYRTGATALLSAGTDAISAVESRFALLEALGFWPRCALLSLLVFLAVYAAVSALRQGGWFWNLFLLWHVVVLSSCLILLNMKWPVVLFIITLGLCPLLLSRRYGILKSATVMTAGAAAYLMISVVLLRLVPAAETIPSEASLSTSSPETSQVEAAPEAPSNPARPPAPAPVEVDSKYLSEVVTRSGENSATLFIKALNRMAVAVPYYYKIFSEEGQVCGTLWDRILRRQSPCQPSLVVYTRMFGADGFEGRGTAVAAVHIYGYALGAWPGVVLTLVLTGIALGCFLAVWPAAQSSNMMATVFVMGGYAAYFWSQLPFEAAFIYDHGMLWWAGLVAAYSGAVWLWERGAAHRLAAG